MDIQAKIEELERLKKDHPEYAKTCDEIIQMYQAIGGEN
jgi:hypothetical protein